jgi:hypothetical protein
LPSAFAAAVQASPLFSHLRDTARWQRREKKFESSMAVFRKTARNYNSIMATAADHVIAEVEEIVELGALNPDCVHTPGVFVDAIFQGTNYEKRIERRTVRKR